MGIEENIGLLYRGVSSEESERVVDEVYFDMERMNCERAKLEGLVSYDTLTGAGSRRAFEERLVEEDSRARRSRGGYAVAGLDIDLFKGINDTYGHAVGDEALKVLVNTIKDNTRATDGIYRWGGDEFYVILGDVKSEEAASAAMGDLVRNVRNAVIDVGDGRSIGMTISAGVCLTDGNMSREDLLRRADEALYEVKRVGRDGFKVYQEVII